MTAHQSQVEIVQLRLIKSLFMVNPEPDQAEERVAIAASLKSNGEFFEDGRQANFNQILKTGTPGLSPFILEVEYEAIFHLNPAPLPLERPYFVRKIFSGLVFPYLREYVAEITRRAGFNPLIISQSLFEGEPGAPEQPGEPTMPPEISRILH